MKEEAKCTYLILLLCLCQVLQGFAEFKCREDGVVTRERQVGGGGQAPVGVEPRPRVNKPGQTSR